MSVWNNMRYGWSSKLSSRNFSKESSIWILGRCYHQKCSSMESSLMGKEKSIENKLMTTSLHEELPTSSESYYNFDMAMSPSSEAIDSF